MEPDLPLLTNAEFRQLKELHHKKGRTEQNAFLIEGEKGVVAAVEARWNIKLLLFTENFAKTKTDFLNKLSRAANIKRMVSGEVMKALSTVVTPPELLAVLEQQSNQRMDVLKSQTVIVLEDIADPGNLGTIIRTADWFGISALILSVHSVDPYNDKVVRASMGSFFHLQIYQSVDLIKDLAYLGQQGYCLIAADLHNSQPSLKDLPFKKALIFGSESHGISAPVLALADQVITIPGFGKAESLNVAVSAAILMHQLTSK